MTTLFDQIAEITRPVNMAQIMGTPAQPEERKPILFTTIAQVFEEVRKIGHADKLTWRQFNDLHTDLTNQGPAIMAMINKMTMPEINKYIYKRSSTDTKKEMVSNLYGAVFSSFNLGGLISYSPFGGSGPQTYAEALKIQLAAQTEQQYIKYCEERQAARDQRKKALENPETLEEFRTFLHFKGSTALTADQRTRYDALITDTKQERREQEQERKAEVTAVTVEGLEMEIKKSRHTKKNIDLWVVVMNTRVETDVFKELSSKAKRLGGYYSSYRGGEAIPGFTFESEEAANNFAGLTEQGVNTHEANKAEATENRAETLEEKAARIAAAATESLNRDRKDNTYKRAREAASAERTALANLEFADTMARIAEGQKAGTVKYLGRLANITDLATLNGILSSAKYLYINANKINTQTQDTSELNNDPAIIEHVKFPYPSVWVSNVIRDFMALENVKGCKMAAARMQKRFKNFKEEVYTFTSWQQIEDFETLLCTYHKTARNFYGQVDRYKEDLMKYRRLMRMHMESLPELRTALRELQAIKKGVTISPEMKKAQEIKELERKFIGAQIPGFFPTPGETDPNGLARQIVDLANVQTGNTILEPSAGLGHLADVITEVWPDNELIVVEHSYSLCEALKLKGYQAQHEDFLQHTGTYDRIIMNPPFENGQDIQHVLHAYSLLNEGGRLVAIMAGNKNKQDQHTRDFMEFLESAGGSIEENPAGSFLSAFRPTGVNTVTVILDK
jgi:hypothetical protein